MADWGISYRASVQRDLWEAEASYRAYAQIEGELTTDERKAKAEALAKICRLERRLARMKEDNR